MNGDYAIRSFEAELTDTGVSLEYQLEDENGVSGTLVHNLNFTEAFNLGLVLKQWGMGRSKQNVDISNTQTER